MKSVKIEVLLYEMENNFFVEVQKNGNIIEFWIYHRNYSIKSFMFGIPKKYINGECDIKNFILSNFEEHKNFYIQDYMQEDKNAI